MLPAWFVVFAMLFTPLVCLASVVMGAYIMYCREQKTNPLRSGLTDFIYFPRIEEEPGERQRGDEEVKGFYS